MAKLSREICIKLADGTQYCKRSPIRDCGCSPESKFVDPFSDLPSEVTADSFSRDLEGVLRIAEKGDASAYATKLQTIYAIAQLILLPKVNISLSFIISSLDLPIVVPIPTPSPSPIPPAQSN